jgi:hypothetical protein
MYVWVGVGEWWWRKMNELEVLIREEGSLKIFLNGMAVRPLLVPIPERGGALSLRRRGGCREPERGRFSY